MSTNRRENLRFQLAVAAEIAVGRDDVYECTTRDISEGGVSVIGPRAFEEGAELQVTLLLTQDGIEDPDEMPFTAPARVMWAAPTDGGGGIAGLRFAALDSAQQAHLARFIEALRDQTA
jgi:c-di-GMP-binding flagellar brake protein YcgR